MSESRKQGGRTSAPVGFREISAQGGYRVGVATLDAQATLNALSLEMAERLAMQLDAWATDPAIAVVVLEGEGRALCAGGDLQSVYREMRDHRGDDPPRRIARFFEREYGLNHAIHAYPKPFLCWGNGIVMGGGMGLLIGASHRVVTESSRLAMPEIAIGLFPDVGMSWALNRMPGKSGLFLGLTGATLQAADALFAGWADYHIPQARKQQVLDALARQTWTGERRADDLLLHDVLDAGHVAPDPVEGPLRRNLDTVAALCRAPALDDVIGAILQYDGADPWLEGARDALAKGAPSTARLAWELQRRTRHMSLAQVFQLEYQVALWCCTRGDFQEGIRALLIDKDRHPVWKATHGTEVGTAWADKAFCDMAADFPVPASLRSLAG
ncbi:MAG: hypothetical protein ABS43_00745 [Bordetella sp. SCN 67-23]|nr:enoyl-CoA hydratase/isomerase family protein [Burkholderiales bacterium]ODS76713.1 MAG: hypothetical protein ABS43_00745 [Bordetella sp. SCN 67-23]ODU69390.1 MAG: hypothetical protein ABT00_19060 [Bordetella sp. SCN 68-11]OJW93835.1 MAG: hypothetical protein BGO71_18255 [Burkholderiales bacterium 67-32]